MLPYKVTVVKTSPDEPIVRIEGPHESLSAHDRGSCRAPLSSLTGSHAYAIVWTMYSIEFSEGAVEDLQRVRSFEHGQILDVIEEQLKYEPTAETRNRKLLSGLTPSFEAVPPVWELRVGDYRVFYDVDEEEKRVYVRAIRRKPPDKTTEEIL